MACASGRSLSTGRRSENISRRSGPMSASFIGSPKSPFRLAAGSKDPMVELSHMASFDPKAVLFEGLGHNAHVEDPARVWAFIAGD